MKLTIAGDLGSGKSSVAKRLSEEYNYRYISTGQLHRDIAEEYGVDALELNKIANVDQSIDNKIDGYLIGLNESPENFIIDSRLAWHFVKNSFKIYLEVHSEIGAERVFSDSHRLNEPEYSNKEAALKILRERKAVENERFFNKYKLTCNDRSNYDVVINTSTSTIADTCILIKKLTAMWKEGIIFPKLWISPNFLFPTEHVRIIASDESKELKDNVLKNGFDFNFPISCVKFNEFYFIWDGHKRFSSSLYIKMNYVPVYLLGEDQEDIQKNFSAALFVQDSFNQSWYYDWEDAHNFKYIKFPKLITS